MNAIQAHAISNDSIAGLNLDDITFAYDVNIGTVTSAQVVSATQNIDSLSNFVWKATTFFAYKDGVSTPMSDTIIRPFTIQITNSANGRTFFSGATPIDDVAGTGKFPFVLPNPYLWRANAVIQVTLTNLDTAQWDNVHLTLWGLKTFYSIPV